MKSIHFISGLPRSGSTLLAAILRQNPRFHASMSSPLMALFGAMLGAMSTRNEFSVFIEEGQREAILRGVFETFYAHLEDAEVIFDTNRAWCSKMSALAQLMPDAKVIGCVRNVAWVLDSFERLVQSNGLDISRMFHGPATPSSPHAANVYARAEQAMDRGGLVRGPLDALREAYYGERAGNLILVRYESLTRRPQETIEQLYEFLKEPPFKHDFDDVEFSADEFDLALATPGLHTVRRKVEFKERRMILPPDIAAKYDIDFWNDAKMNFRGVRLI